MGFPFETTSEEFRSMRIAQVAPLTEAVPPTLYGGTERVISWLTEELVALGHDVTLFASGDSVTAAKLEPMWPRALRLDGTVRDPNALNMTTIEKVYRRAHEFDLIHFHLDYYPFSVMSLPSTKKLTTLHGRLDLPADLLQPQPVQPRYLAFLGRISPEKRVDRAIGIAERCGLPLKIAAKVDRADQDYFDETIKPLLSKSCV